MSTWKSLVRRELLRYRSQTGTDIVERQEFLRQARPVFRSEYPNNENPGQQFSKKMQELGRAGEVEFVDNDGTYRILELAGDVAEYGEATRDDRPTYHAATYETTATARSIPRAFRTGILNRYDCTCPVSGVDVERLLDVAHVLAWSDYPDHRTNPGNVLLLSKTHHAAFDAGLFTIDADHRLHVSPAFETESSVLRQTLVDREHGRLALPWLDETCLARHNRELDWFST